MSYVKRCIEIAFEFNTPVKFDMLGELFHTRNKKK